MSNKGDYEVGFGKPPKAGQFKPGQSGNPKGRKKGGANLKTDLELELARIISIREGDREIRMPAQRALLRSLMVHALRGNKHAISALLGLMARLTGFEEDEENVSGLLSPEDDEILKNLSMYMQGKD